MTQHRDDRKKHRISLCNTKRIGYTWGTQKPDQYGRNYVQKHPFTQQSICGCFCFLYDTLDYTASDSILPTKF